MAATGVKVIHDLVDRDLGMPLKNGHMTKGELAFVDVMARTGDMAYSAAKAGFASPGQNGNKLMQRPAVRAAVIAKHQDLLANELLPLAYEAHKRLLTEKGVPAGAQLGAVKLAYDRTLGDQADNADAKEPSEMSYDELQASIAALRAEQAAREEGAVDVTPPALEPSDEGIFD